jgi:hypothetical protein
MGISENPFQGALMRRHVLTLLLLGAAALACPNASCGKGMHPAYEKSVLGTLDYALKIMKLQDDPQIRLALQSYRGRFASIPRGMDTEAFKNSAFNRDLFLQKSPGMQKVQAQADLFEQVYAVLDGGQKEELHRLMAAHQYYLDARDGQSTGPCTPKNCPVRRSCP